VKKKGSLSEAPQRPFSIHAQVDRMAKLLERVTSRGYHQHDVFDAFLDITLRTLEDAPMHICSLVNTGKLAEELPETIEVFQRVRNKFGTHSEKAFKIFVECFAILLDSASDPQGERDAVGLLYETFTFPNRAAGQYFTPWPICVFMAQSLTVNPVVTLINDMYLAIKNYDEIHAIWAEALMISSVLVKDEGGMIDFIINKVFPVAYRCGWEHPKVLDAACGSSRMLLAKAQLYPQWMLDASLVEFFGIDIDYTCCQMSRINFILYGLNGSWVPWYLAMAGKTRQSFREEMKGTDWDPDTMKPYKPKEKPAEQPPANPVPPAPAKTAPPDVRQSMRAMTQRAVKMNTKPQDTQQMSLFGDMGVTAVPQSSKGKVGK